MNPIARSKQKHPNRLAFVIFFRAGIQNIYRKIKNSDDLQETTKSVTSSEKYEHFQPVMAALFSQLVGTNYWRFLTTAF